MKLIAPKNRIIVDVIEDPEKIPSGIILPDGVSINPTNSGHVLSVGNAIDDVKEKDVVTFSRGVGNLIIYQGKSYLCLLQGDILAICRE